MSRRRSRFSRQLGLEGGCHRLAVEHLQGGLADALQDNQIEGVDDRLRLRVGLGHPLRFEILDGVLDHRGADEIADVGEVKRQQRDQDEDAAEQGVEEELDGGVLAARAAPDADQEVHGQEHDFPEDVEQEEIQRQERAQHAGFQKQKQHAVAADETVDLPASDHGQKRQHCGQDHERHADAVGAHVVVDVEVRDPRIARQPIAAVLRVALPPRLQFHEAMVERGAVAVLLAAGANAVLVDDVTVKRDEHAQAEAQRQGGAEQRPPAHRTLPCRAG